MIAMSDMVSLKSRTFAASAWPDGEALVARFGVEKALLMAAEPSSLENTAIAKELWSGRPRKPQGGEE